MKSNFTVAIKPDLVDGTIAKLIAANKTDTPFNANDILFDWVAFDVPKGACALTNITVYMMGQDGGVQEAGDIHFVFAKTVSGVAPGTLGVVNAVQTACFELPKHLIGACKIEATTISAGIIRGPAFGSVYHTGIAGTNGPSGQFPLVLQGEPDSGTNVGYDKIYVAAFVGNTGFDFSTGVLANYASGAPGAGSTTSIVVDSVDARKCFQEGDIVYVHDVDTALGTVSSVAETTITLTANNGAAVANNDEIMNATPIRCTFGFTSSK